MKPTKIELASVVVQYAPGGTTSSGIPSITLLPYRPHAEDPDPPFALPTHYAISLYEKVKVGQSLDALLRVEVGKEVARQGYDIDLTKLPPVNIPKDLIDFIGRHQAGLNIEYMEISPGNEKATIVDLWQIEGHTLKEKHIRKVEDQIENMSASGPADVKAFDPFDL